MNRPAVFFDRDNTLIACDGYLGDPDKVVLVDGAAAAVARVRQLGFAAVVFSNQSGVARGMFPEEAVHAVNHRLDDLLHEEDPQATIDRHDFCPFHPNAKVERYRVDSDLRKPKPGMIYRAASALGLDLTRSWVIGDAPRDIAAGHAAGLRTVLLKIASLPPSPATNEGAGASPDFVAGSLQEAVDIIERNLPSNEPEAVMPDASDRSADADLADDDGVPSGDSGSSKPQAAPEAADAWTSPAGPTSTGSAASTSSAVSFPSDWSSSVSSTAGSAPSNAELPPATSEQAVPSTARAEEPVKLMPRPKPSEPLPSTTSKPEASKPEGTKPVQGGFVVKPTQAAPIGITWGERMRLAKGGSAVSSAAAAATPQMPKSASPVHPAEPPPAVNQPAAPAPTSTSADSDSNGTAAVATPMDDTPKIENAPAAKVAEADVEQDAYAPDVDPVEPVAVATSEPEPEPVSAVASADDAQPIATARQEDRDEVEPDEVEAAAAEPIRSNPERVRSTPAAEPEAAAGTPRRGLRREDLLEHAYDVPPEGNDTVAASTPRRRREPAVDARETESRASAPIGDLSRVEALLEQVLVELRRREELASADFSASKLVAGITQVLALAALFYAYFTKDTNAFEPTLLVAIALQTLTISLLIMGKQK